MPMDLNPYEDESAEYQSEPEDVKENTGEPKEETPNGPMKEEPLNRGCVVLFVIFLLALIVVTLGPFLGMLIFDRHPAPSRNPKQGRLHSTSNSK